MSGLSLATIRDTVATVVGAVVNGSASTINCSGYPTNSPELPALLVLPRAGAGGKYVDYHRTMHNAAGALCEIALTIEVRVGPGGDDPGAARQLDSYLSTGATTSIFDALMANTTLSGAIESLIVGGWSVPAWFKESEESARTWLSSSMELTIKAR
jgi:hypothetical protein